MGRFCTSETSAMSVLVQLVGMEKAEAISETFGGETIYIPKRIKNGRDNIIKHEFHEMLSRGGTCMSSYRQLARKYDLSEHRIMEIVNH